VRSIGMILRGKRLNSAARTSYDTYAMGTLDLAQAEGPVSVVTVHGRESQRGTDQRDIPPNEVSGLSDLIHSDLGKNFVSVG
jgi:hypothetical protein